MNFGNGIAEIQQKYERKRKSGRGKILNFDNYITEILADRNQLWQCHCRNRGGKNILWQYHCRKWEEKKKIVVEIWGGIKKKSATSTIFLQHFHNKSQVISYY